MPVITKTVAREPGCGRVALPSAAVNSLLREGINPVIGGGGLSLVAAMGEGSAVEEDDINNYFT